MRFTNRVRGGARTPNTSKAPQHPEAHVYRCIRKKATGNNSEMNGNNSNNSVQRVFKRIACKSFVIKARS
jgi:hypothetical protein